ncbi:MAG: HIT domain-containing protein [Chlamydiae bacterium]|nr:HIT domain-containing protein [Chlamydiota bacterium]MBI3267180.1 HIT domain-containing protein [Chlamydiota bacterium]
MKHLWAPWRLHYIKHAKEKVCIFCQKSRGKKDRKNLILKRGRLSFALLNLFPYNSGHFMVTPYRHVGKLEKLNASEIQEMFELINHYKNVIEKKLRPQGFNIGMNLGRVGGAGIVDHVHIHVVPRWNGDTNFMPVLADTKIIPQALDETYLMMNEK